jgi:hypothetical protein
MSLVVLIMMCNCNVCDMNKWMLVLLLCYDAYTGMAMRYNVFTKTKVWLCY